MSYRTSRELAFVDPSIFDLQGFLAGLRPGIEAIILSPSRDALAQISEELRGRAGLDAIHVVAHGRPGEVSFSSGAFTLKSLGQHAAELRAVGDALARDGAVMLWACETGKGATGARFIGALERATGAEVHAATAPIGAEAMGGSWHLDAPGESPRQAPLTAAAMRSYAGVLVGQNYQATPQVDHAVQTPEPDTVTFNNPNQIQSQDFFDGLAGVNKIVLAGAFGNSLEFSKYGAEDNLGFHNYQGLVFGKTWNYVAVFDADQFGNGLLSNAFEVTGTPKLRQAIVVEDARNFSAEAWKFSSWSNVDSGSTITFTGTNGNDVITGSSQRDILEGGDGKDVLSGGDEDDTITGGRDEDTLTGGGGRNIFHFNVGDNRVLIGGKGKGGQVAGFDVITDYKASVFFERSEKLQFDVELSRSNPLKGDSASKLELHTGDTVKSYGISEGMISFSGAAKFEKGKAVDLTSLSDVAAAVQFLQSNSQGGVHNGALSFTATINDIDHTFVWSTLQNGMLIDLSGVRATSMGIDGFWIALVDDNAPPQGGNPAIHGNDGNNSLEGGGAGDALLGRKGNDLLEGLGGDDKLKGGPGADTLKGGAGEDVLLGHDGSDKLDGGRGDDALHGGPGADKFIFKGIFGADAIVDFSANDKIVLEKSIFENFFAVQAALSIDGANHVVIDAGVSSITLYSVHKTSALHANDFDFV